ncbi:MAG: hypothetical protein LAKADJCE_00852 [Candidatus Argoarchaeum ethanivorans]|uniref:Uncharacterized protein n=1 Tax=Candidatus Argoarchaeum ethanivorans TaxID=2608793 RepID=A0A811TFV8_9EURY|nr:MAG: hypothetical protein LAKADJCE_00852 [Candidatus Argoarchaeum ethanivorans]
MNISPMIFLFSSGSVVPFKACRKRSLPFMTCRFTCLNVFFILSVSPSRMSPVSMYTGTRSLPIALCARTVQIELSTPPDKAISVLPEASRLIRSTAFLIKVSVLTIVSSLLFVSVFVLCHCFYKAFKKWCWLPWS